MALGLIFYLSSNLRICAHAIISLSDAPLGGTCDAGSTDQCSDSKAGCLFDEAKYICTCEDGFYDDNGFALDGNCQGSRLIL